MQARRIEVEVHYDERQLRLRVRDDGRGVDSQVFNNQGRPGHWGLRGMRERAKLVGGCGSISGLPVSRAEIGNV